MIETSETSETIECQLQEHLKTSGSLHLKLDLVLTYDVQDGSYVVKRIDPASEGGTDYEILREGAFEPWEDNFQVYRLSSNRLLVKNPNLSFGWVWSVGGIDEDAADVRLELIWNGEIQGLPPEAGLTYVGDNLSLFSRIGKLITVVGWQDGEQPHFEVVGEGELEPGTFLKEIILRDRKRIHLTPDGGWQIFSFGSLKDLRLNIKSIIELLLRGIKYIVRMLLHNSLTLYVDGSSTGVETGTKQNPYQTIGAALQRAISGDIIDVAPGLYRENIVLKSGVTVISQKTGAAIIHGGAQKSGGNPTVTGADGAAIEGFAIAGGYDGVLCKGTSPTIGRNIIRGNYGDGGIICLDGAQPKIHNNTILANLGNSVNHISVGIYAERATPEIVNNIVTGNDFGISAYFCQPLESYNNVWGNLTNFGYSGVPGTGTISVDPEFIDPTSDDYRLSQNSPCRTAGSSSAIYHQHIGAFLDGGGYSVSLPAQEYFVESCLNAQEHSAQGLEFEGTKRYRSNPTFYFPPGHTGKGATETEALLKQYVPTLTSGKYQAQFHTGTTPPSKCEVVTVTFPGGGRGWYYLKGGVQGVTPECQVDASGQWIPATQPIVGGFVELYSEIKNNGYGGVPGHSRDSLLELLIHETGHAFGQDHSYRGIHSVSRAYVGANVTDYTEVEKESFALKYSYPPGTELKRFIDDGKIVRSTLTPFPRIDEVYVWSTSGNGWEAAQTTSANDVIKFQVKAGSEIIIVGSRLTIRFGQNLGVNYPSYYSDPVMYFAGGAKVTIDSKKAYQKQPPQNSFSGGFSRNLKLKIPNSAQTGWGYLKVRAQESNPIWLEIS